MDNAPQNQTPTRDRTATAGLGARVAPLGDSALTLAVAADPVDEATGRRILGLARKLRDDLTAGRLPGVTDVVSGFASLTLCLDPATADRARLSARLAGLAEAAPESPAPSRRWVLPVCYDAEFAPDIDRVAARGGLAFEDVAAIHRACRFRVLALGFLPGFPYLGPLDARLAVPRRETPHTRVAAGAVGVAMGMSCVYPWPSPGGWNLIGRCPVPLFDSRAAVPNTLEAGDRVRFVAVDRAAYEDLKAAAESGRLDPTEFRDREAAWPDA